MRAILEELFDQDKTKDLIKWKIVAKQIEINLSIFSKTF